MNELIDTVIDDIYQTAIDPSNFPKMFENICHFLRASHGFFLLLSDRSIVNHSYNLNPDVQIIYNELYTGKDPWYNAAVDQGVCDQVMTGQELVPVKEFKHTDFYHDILVPDQILDIMSVTIESSSTWNAGFSFHRSENEALFDRSDKASLNLLLPHLKRMIRLRKTLEHQSSLNEMSMAMLDRLEVGIVVLNQNGKIIYTNQTADLILSSGDGLTSQNGCLAAEGANKDRLACALFKALGSDSVVAGSEVCIRRTDGKFPYVVQVLPVRLDETKYLLTAAVQLHGALVVITDPENSKAPAERILREALGLTATEALLALQLFEGKSVKDIAEDLRLGEGTTRWHLKNIQSKTDTHRQSELVSLIARLSPKSRTS